jgi:transcriptional antiterminator
MYESIKNIIEKDFYNLINLKSLTPLQLYELSEFLKKEYPDKNVVLLYKTVKLIDEHLHNRLQSNIISTVKFDKPDLIVRSIINSIDCYFVRSNSHS